MTFFLACLLAVLPGASARSRPTPCRIQFPGDAGIRPTLGMPLSKSIFPQEGITQVMGKIDCGSGTEMEVSHFKARGLLFTGNYKKDLDLEPNISMR